MTGTQRTARSATRISGGEVTEVCSAVKCAYRRGGIPHNFWGDGEGRIGLQSKTLCNGMTDAYRSWQPKQQRFVATGYFGSKFIKLYSQ